jgi:protein disulfide-isomerase
MATMQRWLGWSVVGLLLWTCGDLLPAAEVSWQSDVDQAWQQSVRENRPLLVFVTSSNCRYCTQMRAQTFRDEAVASYLDHSFIAVAVDSRKVDWLVKQMQVTAFPTTLIISPEAEVLARLKGFVPPDKLLPQLERIAPPGPIASRPMKKTS